MGIHICGRDEYIDGPFTIIGAAGPKHIRHSTGTAITGHIRFDVADIGRLIAEGRWEAVILHEMAHVIGFGTLWAGSGVVGPKKGGYPYYGPVATSVWTDEWGCDGTPPVETDGGRGTAGGHWDEACLGDEIMTGYLDSVNRISKLTAASFVDLGYSVDYGSDFIDNSYNGTSTSCCHGHRRERSLRAHKDKVYNTRLPSHIGLQRATVYGKALLKLMELPEGVPRAVDDVVYVGDKKINILFQEGENIFVVDINTLSRS